MPLMTRNSRPHRSIACFSMGVRSTSYLAALEHLQAVSYSLTSLLETRDLQAHQGDSAL